LVRLLLRFSERVVDQPITAQVILEKGVLINILSGHINHQKGELLVEVPSANAEEIAKAFRDRGATVVISKLIEVESERCFNCGACLSLCPVKVISLGEDFSVTFDEEKCMGATCGICVDACPARAIKLVK